MGERWSDPAALVTGRQAYLLEIRSAPSASKLSVVSFRAVERLGEPYELTVQLTHPLELDRADYLTKPATFVIQPADGSEPRRFAGRITSFGKTRQTQDFCAYEMVVQPEVALLGLTTRSRVYQHKSAPQIIEAILRSHDLLGHQFDFKTRRRYLVHDFRLQHQMSDWEYIRLLMEQEGLYSYFVPGKFGEMIVFGDDIDHYIYQPELRVPYRETAGLEAGIEAVFALQIRAKTVPESFLGLRAIQRRGQHRAQGPHNLRAALHLRHPPPRSGQRQMGSATAPRSRAVPTGRLRGREQCAGTAPSAHLAHGHHVARCAEWAGHHRGDPHRRAR